MNRETITLDVTIEFDNEDALDDTISAIVTMAENSTPAKGARIISIKEV